MPYRDQLRTCELCGREISGAAVPQGGLLTCTLCDEGRSSAALIEHGLHVQTIEEQNIDGEDFVSELAHVLGGIDYDLPIEASFSREGILGRWLKVDLQTGDKVFDDAVSVCSAAREPLARLLALEPVRWAIIDLLDCTRVELSGGLFRASALAGDAGALRRPASIMVWGMAQLARSLGLPRRAPRTLPTLEVLSARTQTKLLVQGDRIDPGIVAAVPEATLVGFSHVEFTSDDLSRLTRSASIEALRLIDIPQVRSVEALGHLPTLQTLVLAGCPVADVRPLARLTGLRRLNLGHTRVSDLSPLQSLSELEEIVLGGLHLDQQHLADLRQSCPRLRIAVD